ncbi:MAG: hypothetical protein HY540_02970 [Deltaproteobacteria bacterium]|nr:hypothetical protein [Deltaproteobacteria bacterium]
MMVLALQQSVFMSGFPGIPSGGVGLPMLADTFSIGALTVERYTDPRFTDPDSYKDGSGDIRNYRFLLNGAHADRADLEQTWFLRDRQPPSPFDLMQHYHGFKVIHFGGNADVVDNVVRFTNHTGEQHQMQVAYPRTEKIRRLVEQDLTMVRAMPFWVVKRIVTIIWPTAEENFLTERNATGGCTEEDVSTPAQRIFSLHIDHGNGDNRARNTLFHELGHVVEAGENAIRDQVILAMALDGELVESHLAYAHWREQFAESFKWYLQVGADRFGRFYPHRADLISWLMGHGEQPFLLFVDDKDARLL